MYPNCIIYISAKEFKDKHTYRNIPENSNTTLKPGTKFPATSNMTVQNTKVLYNVTQLQPIGIYLMCTLMYFNVQYVNVYLLQLDSKTTNES